LSVLILLELKDSVNYQDIGQVLGQRNGLLEKSKTATNSKERMARLYPEHKKVPGKFTESKEIKIKFYDVEVWLVGQVFDDSAYYAAKGQNIFLFKITNDMQIKGPVYAGNLTRTQFEEFNSR